MTYKLEIRVINDYYFDFKNGGTDLIYSVDKENRTPIHHAAYNGSLQVCRF